VKVARQHKRISRGHPVMTLEALVREHIKKRDPYSLRWAKEKTPKVVFQLEYDTEVALYAAFDSSALAMYARTLRRCWSLFGIGRGDCVGIFDYGTSPVSYLASSIFTPYLRRGAADILGCLAVCNDGVANLSRRALEIVKYARPRVLFLRSDCLHPFATEVTRNSLTLSSHVAALVAVANEAVLSEAERDSYQAILGVPVYRLVRADAVMFFAPECPQCRFFHIWPDLYHVETAAEGASPLAGSQLNRLVITNRFSRSFRYLTQVAAVLEPAGCPASPRDLRMSA
jgi:phenylacetate-coenzyme A ligase PaaK-like adenylate-forming protein